jgi:6-phosphogluconate dehydrogenase
MIEKIKRHAATSIKRRRTNMELGMIGLGKMGGNMARRLARGGHRIVAYDISPGAAAALAEEEHNIEAAASLEELATKLDTPRPVWFMVPAGDVTEETIGELLAELSAGDIIIDGGNSYYKDSIRRAARVADEGMHFVDVGTSGGIWGLNEGYSLMVGGDEDTVWHLRSIFETLAPAPDKGWGRVGANGAGHFVKMIHNGIEYGIMQAYAEGFDLMSHKTDFALDLHQVAEIWRSGSVVRSWLLDLTARALADNPTLEGIAPHVADSGEGRWTVMEAIDLGVALPVISLALEQRFRSRDDEPFSDKLLAAMRHQFGGHAIKKD